MIAGSGRLSSFVWGGLIGLAVGVLYAPKSGKETRDELKKRADEYLEQGLEEYEVQKDRVLEAVEMGRQTAVDTSEDLKNKIQETRDKLKAQVDAAAETAKEKINAAAGKVRDVSETPLTETPE